MDAPTTGAVYRYRYEKHHGQWVPVGVVCVIQAAEGAPTHLLAGWALCHGTDQFSRKRGRQIAYRRAIDSDPLDWGNERLQEPDLEGVRGDIPPALLGTAQEAVADARRYFKLDPPAPTPEADTDPVKKPHPIWGYLNTYREKRP